jgi:hypothetical protein
LFLFYIDNLLEFYFKRIENLMADDQTKSKIKEKIGTRFGLQEIENKVKSRTSSFSESVSVSQIFIDDLPPIIERTNPL